jgi:hypothetical protein
LVINRESRSDATSVQSRKTLLAVVLAADVLLGPRVGPPLWTCTSSDPPAAVRRPPPARDPSTATIEELVSHSDCTDRAGVPLALVAFVTTAILTYRRVSRRRS